MELRYSISITVQNYDVTRGLLGGRFIIDLDDVERRSGFGFLGGCNLEFKIEFLYSNYKV